MSGRDFNNLHLHVLQVFFPYSLQNEYSGVALQRNCCGLFEALLMQKNFLRKMSRSGILIAPGSFWTALDSLIELKVLYKDRKKFKEKETAKSHVGLQTKFSIELTNYHP